MEIQWITWFSVYFFKKQFFNFKYLPVDNYFSHCAISKKKPLIVLLIFLSSFIVILHSDLSTNRITSLHKDTFKDLTNLTELWVGFFTFKYEIRSPDTLMLINSACKLQGSHGQQHRLFTRFDFQYAGKPYEIVKRKKKYILCCIK